MPHPVAMGYLKEAVPRRDGTNTDGFEEDIVAGVTCHAAGILEMTEQDEGAPHFSRLRCPRGPVLGRNRPTGRHRCFRRGF
jgi:hypothetical protein